MCQDLGEKGSALKGVEQCVLICPPPRKFPDLQQETESEHFSLPFTVLRTETDSLQGLMYKPGTYVSSCLD